MNEASALMELLKEVANHTRDLAVHTQQIGELARRVGVLEGQFWAIIVLLVGNLTATVINLKYTRANGNHKKGG